jgi:uncharacterized protein (DUF952 family)
MELVYHITTPAVWSEAQARGHVVADSLASEEFIHCSRQGQLLAVADRFFAGVDRLLVLAVDAAQVAEWLVNEGPANVEDPFAEDVFPHIYGPIPTTAVVAVATLDRDRVGRWVWPVELPKNA